MTKQEEIDRLERFLAEYPSDSYAKAALGDFVEMALRSIRVDHFMPTYCSMLDDATFDANRIKAQASAEATLIKEGADRVLQAATGRAKDIETQAKLRVGSDIDRWKRTLSQAVCVALDELVRR